MSKDDNWAGKGFTRKNDESAKDDKKDSGKDDKKDGK